MKLIYSYISTHGFYTNTDDVLDFYKASMISSKRLGYKIKLYGCEYTLNYLKGYYDEFVDVSTEEIILLDDLKILIHSKEDLNCITIDGDLFLKNKLYFPKNCDVYFEHKLQVLNPREETQFAKYFKIFKKYNIEQVIPQFNYENEFACNMGLLKFGNQETKDLFISSYYKLRNWFLENIEPNENIVKYNPAVVICEYMFGCLVTKENINVVFLNEFNDYKHYHSQEKWKNQAQRHKESLLDMNFNII